MVFALLRVARRLDAFLGDVLVERDHSQRLVAEAFDRTRVFVGRGHLHVNLALVEQGDGAGFGGDDFWASM